MNIDELNADWASDCTIDENHLDRESVKTPNLHAKYLRLLSFHKMKQSALEADYNNMRTRKFRYYRGEMTRDELTELGWDQWQGTKPLKNEMDEFLTGDADLNKILIKCAYMKTMVATIESIMNQIKARDWSIRNAIEWKKFIAGN